MRWFKFVPDLTVIGRLLLLLLLDTPKAFLFNLSTLHTNTHRHSCTKAEKYAKYVTNIRKKPNSFSTHLFMLWGKKNIKKFVASSSNDDVPTSWFMRISKKYTYTHDTKEFLAAFYILPSHYYLKLLSISNANVSPSTSCEYWPNHYKTRALLYQIITHAFVLVLRMLDNIVVKNVCMMQFITSFDIFCMCVYIKKFFHFTQHIIFWHYLF